MPSQEERNTPDDDQERHSLQAGDLLGYKGLDG